MVRPWIPTGTKRKPKKRHGALHARTSSGPCTDHPWAAEAGPQHTAVGAADKAMIVKAKEQTAAYAVTVKAKGKNHGMASPHGYAAAGVRTAWFERTDLTDPNKRTRSFGRRSPGLFFENVLTRG